VNPLLLTTLIIAGGQDGNVAGAAPKAGSAVPNPGLIGTPTDGGKPAGVDRTTVRRLVLKLDAADPAERGAAQRELLALGPGVLEHLAPVDAREHSAEQRIRLRELVPRLRELAARASAAGSIVEPPFGRPIPVMDMIRELERHSGNRFEDLRLTFNEAPDNPAITLERRRAGFWETLDEIGRKGRLGFYHAGEDRRIGIRGRVEKPGRIAYAGAFRFELERISVDRLLAGDDADAGCTLRMVALVEPRLRPLAISLAAKGLEAEDDRGAVHHLANDTPFETQLERDAYQFPLVIRVGAPLRVATSFKRIEAAFEVTVPSAIETLTLPMKAGATAATPGLRVTVTRVDLDEGQWKVSVVTEDLAPTSIDSHLQPLLEQEFALMDPAGGRQSATGGSSSLFREEHRSGMEYIIADPRGQPGDKRVQLRVPVGAIKVPAKARFENIPLP
jgi:hypothetical protein